MKGLKDCAQVAQMKAICRGNGQASQRDPVAAVINEKARVEPPGLIDPCGTVASAFQHQPVVDQSVVDQSIRNRVQSWIKSNEYINIARHVCREHRLTVFSVCCVLITLIGVLDLWLAVRYSDSILDMEQNPICLYLMQLDPKDLMIFIYGKSAGILTVICVLIGLFNFWERIAMHVTLAVTFFQFTLICYLYVLSDLAHLYRIYLK